MRKYGLWVGLGVIVLVAAVAIGVVAVKRSRPVPEQGATTLPVGTDAMAFVDRSGSLFGNYTAPVTDQPARITRDAAIQAARGLGEGSRKDEGSVSAYHVLLSSKVLQPSGGATSSPVSKFRKQGQSVWMVVFTGVTRRSRHGGAVPLRADGSIATQATQPPAAVVLSKGINIVFIDAETGDFIESISMPMSPPQR